MRMPGEPPLVSPRRTVMVSPGARNPRTTDTVSVRDHGRISSFGWNSSASFAPLLADAVTKFAAAGSVNCGRPRSLTWRVQMRRLPVSSMPNRPAVKVRTRLT